MSRAQAGPSKAPPNSLAFPSFGDHFSSINTFKLAAFRACLAHNVCPSPAVGASTHAHVACRFKSSLGEGPCTFFVGASNREYRGSGVAVKVDRRYVEHSCDARERAAHAQEARAERRVARMEERVGEEKRKQAVLEGVLSQVGSSRAAKKQGERRRRASALNWEHECSVESGSSEDECSAESGSSEDESSDEPDDDEEAQEPQVAYPSSRELHERADALLERVDQVEFPDTTDNFASAAAHMTVLWAYARLRNFALCRRSAATRTTRFDVVCSRGHNRGPSSLPCPVRVVASLKADGRWSVDSSTHKHNHELGATVTRGRDGESPQGVRKRARADSTDSAASDTAAVVPGPAPLATPAPPAPYHPRSFAPVSLQPGPPTPAPPAPPLRAPPALSPPAPPSNASPVVVAFLTGALPRHEDSTINSVASTLSSAGLSTNEDLTALILFEPATIALLEKEARRRECGVEGAWSLIELQRELLSASGIEL